MHDSKSNTTAGFPTSVWDRLTGLPDVPGGLLPGQRLSLAQYQRAIARDLEVLFNTHAALQADARALGPVCENSIVNFGLADFAHLCLTSSDDRKEICDQLVAAVTRHEPRLTHVRALLTNEAGTVNRLSFVISGKLRALDREDRVRFDLTLEPATLKYCIR